MRLLAVLALAAILVCAVAQETGPVRFDDHVVVRMKIDLDNSEQVAFVRRLHTMPGWETLDWWSELDIRVAPSRVSELKALLAENKIESSVMISNVQALVEKERAYTAAIRLREQSRNTDLVSRAAPEFFDDYRKLEEIQLFMINLQKSYPGLVQNFTVGKSYEGRPVYGLKIGNPAKTDKRAIYFEGGIHAREWVSHSTTLYIAYTLLSTYATSPITKKILDELDFHIVPVVNPDGYVYTWTTDRMHRKTTKPNPGSRCIGTDPNRNWDSHWCEAGASRDPCSDAYCGTAPFTEVETKNVADYVARIPNCKVFVDFHSYSQFWMSPYGYTDAQTADGPAQQELGQASVKAIKAKHGKSYTEGTIYEVVYPASGSSADWAYDVAHVKYAYGVELRDTGVYGFLLPADQIVPTGEEIFEATLVMANRAMTDA